MTPEHRLRRARSEVHKDQALLLTSVAFVLFWNVHVVAWALVGILVLPNLRKSQRERQVAESECLREAEIVAHEMLARLDPEFAQTLAPPSKQHAP